MNVLDLLDVIGLDGPTWAAWRAFVRALYGLPMEGNELATFQESTGLAAPAVGGYRTAAVIAGRQSGKSAIGAALAVFEAARIENGRGLVVPVVAQDERAARRVVGGYVREAFRTPALASLVDGETADTLTLTSGLQLAVYPCRAAALRGLRAPFVVVDELAHFRDSADAPVDVEVLRAVRATTLTTGGRVVILSSPYAASGSLYELHRKHHGQPGPVLVWQAPSRRMNPLLAEADLALLREADPFAARAEIDAEFLQGVGSLFDPEALQAVVDPGVRERAPETPVWIKGRAVAPTTYVAHYDASGGRVDAAALSVAHMAGELVVLDVVRRWGAPHDPAAVIAEAASILRSYRCEAVQVDRFAGEFPVSAFRQHGIRAAVAAKSTSEHHLGLLPLVNAGRVRLLDDPTLLRELRGLERRTGSGRDRVDHRRGAHDDVAAAVSGVVAAVNNEVLPVARMVPVSW